MDYFVLFSSLTLATIAYAAIAKAHVLPRLAALPRSKALEALIWPHAFRFVGLAFLIPGVTAEPLDPRFATAAAYGDLVAAVLALLAIAGLRRGWSAALLVVWAFNIEGFLDLANAVVQGLRFVPIGAFGATFFIPTVIVPLLLVTHVLVFRLLLQSPTDPGERVA